MATLTDVITAAKEAGWVIEPGRFPGEILIDNSRYDVPTPDYMHGSSSWPFDTYLDLNQVVLLVHEGRLSAAWVRTGVPWVQASMRQVSAKRAIEHIRSSATSKEQEN